MKVWLAVAALVVAGIALSVALPGFISYKELGNKSYSVTYDKRSIKIDGKPTLFLSGSVHPPRGTLSEWGDVFSEARENGLNMVEVYVFWNFHEAEEGKINWNSEDNRNLRNFISLAAANNLFVNLRIGPYVCAEWEYGGIPVWLGQKEGIQFRTNNPIWMRYMQQWFETVIDQLEDFFPNSGGPIVLVQVENELNGAPQEYVNWAGKMAEQAVSKLGAPPIIMCNGQSAPNTINTCNGNDCSQFIESHGQSGQILVTQPALWTENEGGFQIWGNSPYKTTNYFWGRSTQDMSVSILKWFARGGSHMNYYMYYGGNNFGPWSGSSITTYYAVDAPICPDALPHEPKFAHLGTLHKTLAFYAESIVNYPAQLTSAVALPWWNGNQWENGTQQYAYIYSPNSNKGVVFIENDAGISITTRYNGKNYTLPEYSVSIVDMFGNEVFNSGKISAPKFHRQDKAFLSTPLTWKSWIEPLSFSQMAQFPTITAPHPYEQNNITKPELWTQYVYYYRNVTYNAGVTTVSIVGQRASTYLLYIDGELAGQVTDLSHWYGPGTTTFTFTGVQIKNSGQHELLILSESLGNDNQMNVGSTAKHKGITGTVKIGNTDITQGDWRMQVGLAGENYQVWTSAGSQKVKWNDNWQTATGRSAWFQASFTVNGMEKGQVLMLNASKGVGRGHVFINGWDLGRYWTMQMNDGSGRATQGLYLIPKSWLHLDGTQHNLLTFGEVLSASDLGQIQFISRKMVPGPGDWKPTGYSVIDSCPMF